MTGTHALRLYQTSIGKKIVMALSGVVLVGFVVVHMLGNLQIYLGAEVLNAYAASLHKIPAVLWGARLVLLAAVGAHVISAAQLWAQNRRARPYRYSKRKYVAATYASRTMYMSGPIVLAFVIYHLLHLTTGQVHPNFNEGSVYQNVVIGFSQWPVAAFYILANVLLGFHLWHGVWSMFQTLGLNNEKWDGRLRVLAKAVATVIVVGNISIPISVLSGWIHL